MTYDCRNPDEEVTRRIEEALHYASMDDLCGLLAIAGKEAYHRDPAKAFAWNMAKLLRGELIRRAESAFCAHEQYPDIYGNFRGGRPVRIREVINAIDCMGTRGYEVWLLGVMARSLHRGDINSLFMLERIAEAITGVRHKLVSPEAAKRYLPG